MRPIFSIFNFTFDHNYLLYVLYQSFTDCFGFTEQLLDFSIYRKTQTENVKKIIIGLTCQHFHNDFSLWKCWHVKLASNPQSKTFYVQKINPKHRNYDLPKLSRSSFFQDFHSVPTHHYRKPDVFLQPKHDWLVFCGQVVVHWHTVLFVPRLNSDSLRLLQLKCDK